MSTRAFFTNVRSADLAERLRSRLLAGNARAARTVSRLELQVARHNPLRSRLDGGEPIDPRVRDQFTWQSAARPTEEIVDVSTRVRATVNVAYRAAKEQTEEHTALAIFAVAGVVLLIFMIRT